MLGIHWAAFKSGVTLLQDLYVLTAKGTLYKLNTVSVQKNQRENDRSGLGAQRHLCRHNKKQRASVQLLYIQAGYQTVIA